MALTKEDIQAISDLIQPIKDDLQEVKQRISNVENKATNLELTLENETNHNIQLLAENHITLIDKLNQSIKVADKTLMYEVQMTSLKSRLELLEKEIAELKNKIA